MCVLKQDKRKENHINYFRCVKTVATKINQFQWLKK